QRQEPVTSPGDTAWLSELSAESIAEASPVPAPARASARAFCLASPSDARRCWSALDATSCQPADAAVAVNANTAPARPVLAGLTRIGLFLFTVVVDGIPDLHVGRNRHADDVEAGIDEMHFTGHAGTKIAEKIERGTADMVELDRL